MIERQARDLDVRGSNPDTGSNFSFEILNFNSCYQGMIKSRRLRWTGYVARMEEGWNSFKI
jgi:hypothetical protein